MKETENVLLAVVPEVKDWRLLTEQLWYRIRQERVPSNISDGTAEYIAFYHTKKYNEELRYKVVFWAKISRIIPVTRKDLFPDDSSDHIKAKSQYLKVEFDALIPLERPIVSRRGHRLLFVPTTSEKLFSGTTNINRLFRTSPLEKRMAEILDDMDITYEREWCEYVDDNRKYHLDFAIFCKAGKIDVECDGDTYHMGYDNVYYDKTRNNELESDKWKVLRYTTKHFTQNEAHIRKTLRKSLIQYHGCLEAHEPQPSYSSTVDSKGQIRLF